MSQEKGKEKTWKNSKPVTGATSVVASVSTLPMKNMGGKKSPASGSLSPQQKVNLQSSVGTLPTAGPAAVARGTCFVCHLQHFPFCLKKGDLKKGNARWNKKQGNSGGQAALNQSVNDMSDQAAGAIIALGDLAQQNAELTKEVSDLTTLGRDLTKDLEKVTSEMQVRDAERDALFKERVENLDVDDAEDVETIWGLLVFLLVWPLIVVPLAAFYFEVVHWFNPIVCLIAYGMWVVLAFLLDRNQCPDDRKTLFWGSKIIIRYSFVSWEDDTHSDQRADVISSGELKHKAAYCWMQKSVIKNSFVRTYKKFLISAELLVQLISSPRNMPLSADFEDVQKRHKDAANNFQSINISKTESLCRRADVVNNTVHMSTQIWLRNQRDMEKTGFH